MTEEPFRFKSIVFPDNKVPYNYGNAMCPCGKQAITCLFRTNLPYDLTGTPACRKHYEEAIESGKWTESISHVPTEYEETI